MDYRNIYDNLINKARFRELPDPTEIHHVLPKCVGGTDSLSNLVELTPREHFFAHLLLIRLYPTNQKLAYAVRRMSKYERYVGSRNYEMAKMHWSILNRRNYEEKYGTERAEEIRKNLAVVNTGKKYSAETNAKKSSIPWNLGKETGIKSKGMTGKTPWNKGKKMPPVSEETRNKLSAANKGKPKPPRSEETKEKLRQSHLQRHIEIKRILDAAKAAGIE